MVAILILTNADAAAQESLAIGLRSLIGLGAFLAAAVYAARTIRGGGPLNLATV
jgi:hypothetical protein